MTEFAWLIEAPGPHYLGVRNLGGHEFFWTADVNEALRFFSEDQADLTMMAVREARPRLFDFASNLRMSQAVEHGWVTADEAAKGEG